MHLTDPLNNPTIVATGREDNGGEEEKELTFDQIAAINSRIVRDAMLASAVVNFDRLPLIKVNGATLMAVLFSLSPEQIPKCVAQRHSQGHMLGNSPKPRRPPSGSSLDSENLPA